MAEKQNPEQQAEEAQQAQEAQLRTSAERLKELLNSAVDGTEGAEAEAVRELLIDGAKKIVSFIQSDELKQLKQAFKGFQEWVNGTRPQRDFSGLYVWAQMFEQMRPAWPYFMEELEKDPRFKEMTFEDFMRAYDENGQRIESEFEKILQRAQGRLQGAETEKTLLAVFPRIQATTPANHIIPITTLATELQNGLLNAGEMNLPVNIGKPNGMTNFVNIAVDVSEDVEIKTDKYTAFDREVDNAVYSLFLYGDESKVFTPAMVYRKMAGKEGQGHKPSKKILQQIEACIDLHRKIDVEIDATEEVNAYMKRKHIDPENKPVRSYWGDRLLPLSYAVVQIGKERIKGYHFLTEPPILAHARTVNKIMTIKTGLLDVKDETGASLPNTEGRIAVKGYLLRRIQQMQRDEKKKAPQLSRIILLETMFKDAGIEKTDAKIDLTKYAVIALESWKRDGFIKDFAQRKKSTGRGIDAFIIDLAEEAPQQNEQV